MNKKSVLIHSLLIVSLWGCSNAPGVSEKVVSPNEIIPNQQSIQFVNISPKPAFTTSSLIALVQERNAGRMAQNPIYRWFKNGVEIDGVQSNTLMSSYFQKGDRISLSVKGYGGMEADKGFKAADLTIHNSLPRVTSLMIQPEKAYRTNPIEVLVQASDADQDPLEYVYQWYKNDQEIQGETSSFLNPEYFSKGERIHVVVAAYDGDEKGDFLQSLPVTVLNSPPEITSNPPGSVNGNGEYHYEIHSEDADNDEIYYELLQGPSGMMVERATGFLSWIPDEGDIGIHSIQIASVDPVGAKGIQKYDLQIFTLEAQLR